MIDFHSHILPCIDDGSSSIEESIKMIQFMQEQGVTTIVATPHFYAQKKSIQVFLEERNQSYEALNEKGKLALEEKMDIRLGAEVYYFPGIGTARELSTLCIEGTNILLLEMPFQQWDHEMLSDIMQIIEKQKLTIMIAHIERYYIFQKNKTIWKKVLQLPLIFQVNAGGFGDRKKRKQIFSLLKENRFVVLGSDCHNMDYRLPNLPQGIEAVEGKFGDQVIAKIETLGTELLTIQEK